VLSTTNAYDTHGRLKGITERNGTGVIAQSSYGYDNLNRLTSTTKNGQTQTYDYDSTDQVKTVTGSNSEAYTYDKNGNRTNSGYVTDAGNRLRSDGTYNYEYDSEGNRITRTKVSDLTVDEYTWDYRNRLMGIVTTDLDGVVTRSVGYTYDVDDLRVSKTVDGVVENYYLDGEQIAFVTDGGGTETFHYLYGLNVDQVLAQDSATGMVWALADRLGSVDALADADGNVVDERTFDSFGRLISQTNPAVSFRYGYTGRELDLESGLDYYRARYYDSAVGRFISVDPMGFGAGDTNLYRYVGNNSTNATDPSGELKLYEGNPLLDGLNLAGTLFNFTGAGIANNIGSLLSGNGYAANPFNDASSALKQVPGIDKLNVSWKFDAGEKFGDAAVQSYAQKFNDPNTPLWQKPGYLAGGLYSALWTTETSDATFAVLSTALTGAKDLRKLGLWAEGKYAGLKLGGAFDGLTKFERTVDGGLAKATAPITEAWGNFSQQASNYLNKVTSVADDIWQKTFNSRLVLKEEGNTQKC
jgi:RHS repeat-associated protein